MKINQDKKQKKLERFFMTPNYTAVLGLTVNKDTDVEDEFENKDERGNMKVQQTIHGTKFTTEKTLEFILDNGINMKETSKVELDLKEGTRLIWLEGKGYILPGENFSTITEIREDIESLKDLALEENKNE